MTSAILDTLPHTASALDRPMSEAIGLPGRFYGDAALEIERDLLFGRAWTPIVVASRIPEPGDMVPVDLAGWPLLAIRNRDGSVGVFFNICRHRGMKLVQEPCSAKILRCPWHSWSYGLDGKLLATPHIGGFNEGGDAVDKAALGLKPVRTAMWMDYVFVDIGGKAPPLDQHLAPLTALMAQYDHAGLVHEGSWDHSYPGNWKIAMEGAIEDYHVPWGHPQLMTDGAWRSSRTWGEPGIFAVTAPSDGETLSAQAGAIGLPEIARHAPDAATTSVINIFPTGVIGTAPDHLMLGLMLPDGADRTRISFDYYFTPAAMDGKFASMRQQRRTEWEEVAPQDEGYVAGVQANSGIRDLAGIDTRFAAAWEGAVCIFQKSVVAALAKPL